MTSREPRPEGALEELVKLLRTNKSRTFELRAQVGDRVLIELWEGEPIRRDEDKNGGLVEFTAEEGVVPLILRIEKVARRAGAEGPRVLMDLSSYTEQELLCLRDSITQAVERALPTARHADAQAKEKMRDEGIPNARLYRAVPTIRGKFGEIETYS